MDLLFLYLLITIIIICVITVFYTLIYNSFQDKIIRINESENNIDSLLRDKYDYLNRAIALIKGNIKIEKEIFEEIVKLRSRKISNFELDRYLVDAFNEFIQLKEEYKELNQSDEIKKITKAIKEIDDKLSSLKIYYNKNISNYNKQVKTFPSNIIAIFSKYKEKTFYDKKDMTDEDEFDFKL